MKTQKYVIVIPLERLAVGYEFSPENYPLHITIVPSFQLKDFSKELLNKIELLCSQTSRFEMIAGSDEYFGSDNSILVTEMLMNDKIRDLHNKLVKLVSDAGAIFDEPEYTQTKYRAHSTVQAHNRLTAGDTIIIDEIAIIDKLPNGSANKRRVIHKIKI